MSRKTAQHFIRSYWTIRYIPYVRALIRNLVATARAA